MPRRSLYGMGNNISGNLVPNGEPVVGLTRIASDCEILWHEWTSTILREDGNTMVLPPRDYSRIFKAGGEVEGRVIGSDQPLAVLTSGTLSTEYGDAAWDDVGITELGVVGCSESRLFFFPSLEDLVGDRNREPLPHPLLLGSKVRIYATHTTLALAVTRGRADHLIRVVFDRRSGRPKLRLVDELEGLGIAKVVAGGDRFGVLTPAGEAYIVDDGVERIDIEDADEIEDIALGDEFEVAIADGRVYGRGNNTFRQLGSEPENVEDWTRIYVPGIARAVFAGRFSTLFQLEV